MESVGRASVRVQTFTFTGAYTRARNLTSAMSVGRALARAQISASILESTLERSHITVASVGRDLAKAPNSSSTREYILERSPMNATSVGRASARAPTSTSTNGFTGKIPIKELFSHMLVQDFDVFNITFCSQCRREIIRIIQIGSLTEKSFIHLKDLNTKNFVMLCSELIVLVP